MVLPAIGWYLQLPLQKLIPQKLNIIKLISGKFILRKKMKIFSPSKQTEQLQKIKPEKRYTYPIKVEPRIETNGEMLNALKSKTKKY